MEDEIVSRNILYSFFETGDIPTQEEFADLINSYVHRREDGVFIFKPDEETKRFGIGLSQPAYRLGIKGEGETEKLISLHDLNDNHKWSVNLNPETRDNRGLNIAQETADGSISRLFIQDASGNIGIGTLYPEQKVHIEHSSPSSTTGIKLFNTATVENNGWIVGHVNEIETPRDGGLSFQSQLEEPVERMLITKSGNVGINEASPYTKLHISMSNSDPKAVIALDETTGIVNIGPITENIVMDFRGVQARAGEFIGDVLDLEASTLNLQRLGGELLIHGDTTLEESKKIIATEDGSVGIGTTTPVEKIDVDGAIKIGNTETLNEGTIRWTGEDFQGYDGSDWESLTGKDPYTKGGTYILVRGLGTPLENGENLLKAVSEGNKLSAELNTKVLNSEEIEAGWHIVMEGDTQANGGEIVSLSSTEIVLSGNVQLDWGSLPIPFTIKRIDFYTPDQTFRTVPKEEVSVITNVTYSALTNQTVYTLESPLPASYNYWVYSDQAVKITVLAAPGQYLLSKSLVLYDDYVDLVSITGNPDVELDLTEDHFYTGTVDLTAFGGDIFDVVNDPLVIINLEKREINLNFVLSVEASCRVKGIRTKKHYSETFQEFYNLMAPEEIEVVMDSSSYQSYNYPLPIDVKSSTDYISVAPTIENCRGGHYSFGFNLQTKELKTILGTYINNEALLVSFGYACSIWGTYENNRAEHGSFGYNGEAEGRFINNSAYGFSFGGGNRGNAGGEFINCTAGDNSFGGNGASGTFINCRAGELSFGGKSASGGFLNCHSNNHSFGGDTAGGIYTNCSGGEGSFGGGEALTGQLYYCRLTSGTFRIVSDSGRTVYCIDGNNRPNNQ